MRDSFRWSTAKGIGLAMCLGSMTACVSGPRSNERLDEYVEFVQKHQRRFPLGRADGQEIRILTGADEIHAAERQKEAHLRKQGYSAAQAQAGAQVGIVAQDPYWVWVRDAVQTEHGSSTYGRLMWKSSLQDEGAADAVSGAAILIYDGQFFHLNVNFRHGTRAWELELPRGGRDPGESITDTGKREVMEELGMTVDIVADLGAITPDSGVGGSTSELLFAVPTGRGQAAPEATEVVRYFKVERKKLEQLIRAGSFEYPLSKHTSVHVHVRDPFLLSAMQLAQLRGLLRPSS